MSEAKSWQTFLPLGSILLLPCLPTRGRNPERYCTHVCGIKRSEEKSSLALLLRLVKVCIFANQYCQFLVLKGALTRSLGGHAISGLGCLASGGGMYGLGGKYVAKGQQPPETVVIFFALSNLHHGLCLISNVQSPSHYMNCRDGLCSQSSPYRF